MKFDKKCRSRSVFWAEQFHLQDIPWLLVFFSVYCRYIINTQQHNEQFLLLSQWFQLYTIKKLSFKESFHISRLDMFKVVCCRFAVCGKGWIGYMAQCIVITVRLNCRHSEILMKKGIKSHLNKQQNNCFVFHQWAIHTHVYWKPGSQLFNQLGVWR